ncbi:MAG: SDR family NAD(P)-dependent oxidoreductase [Terrimesophilobacter sp.]
MGRTRVQLQGKVVAITGGARGIGLEIARACAAAGMKVMIGDLEDAAVQEAAAELGSHVCARTLDVRDTRDFAAFLAATEAEFGPLDVLVNNAGLLRMGPLVSAQPDDIRLQLEVNLAAVITGTQLALQRFVPRGTGHIVNMASSSSMIATANGAVYSATKYGVLGLSRAVRGELRGSDVHITAVMPGVIRTRMTTEFRSAFSVRTIEPAEVGKAVVRALRKGSAEVYVPREVGMQGLLFTVLPARASDWVKHLTRADRVMS